MSVTRVNGQDVRDQGINTVDIKDDAVTTAKILNANVTNVKLDTTGVSAGTYSISSLVVNAQGRITSATELMTTKGDLISFSTVPTRLGVGANGTVLVADSSQSLGIKWLLQSAVAPLSYTSSTGTFSLAGLTSLGSANQIVGVNAAATAWEYKTISGTVNRLSVSQGVGTITLNIDAAYIGQTSITTLGTVTTGTWNGSVVSEIYGGTNQSSYALGDTLYASATNTLSKLPGNITTTRKFLTQTGSGVISAAPIWDVITSADFSTAAPVTQLADQANAAGSASTLVKSDHIHNIPTAIAVSVGASNAQGSSTSFSKADHLHRGISSLKVLVGGTQRFGDIVFLAGSGITLTDDGAGNFTFASSMLIKSGFIAAGSFTGSPKTAPVTFTTAFASTNYSITISGIDNRTWSYSSKTISGFTISANSAASLTGEVSWQAILNGESA